MLERVLERLDLDGGKSVSWDEFKSAFGVYQMHQLAAIYGSV